MSAIHGLTSGDAPPSWDNVDWEAVGRKAYLDGEPGAPAYNAKVRAAIDGMAVGEGAADIMRAFNRGWDAANLATPVEPEGDDPECE